MGLKSKVRKVGKNELKVADEIFLSGTAAEITPVIQIDKRRISDSKVGNITKSLITAYSNIVMNKNEKYSKWLTKVY
jgi:branched-chain amino acid aminotransferase